jgi:hypothetical protein
MTDEKVQTIRILQFSGKDEDWNRWSKTFIATAGIRGYRKALITDNEDEVPTEEDNLKAYSDLLLSCQDDVTFGIVEEATSETFKEGDARVAWKNLKKKFEPNTGAAKVQLKMEFQQMTLEEGEDPDEWINKLQLVRRRLKVFGTEITEDDLILHILNNLPKTYETTEEICEDDLTRGVLTFENLRERLRAKFRRNKMSDSIKRDEVALYAKQFKGTCNVCGKIGHKGVDCFTLEKNKRKKEEYMKKMSNRKNVNENDKSNVKCYNCEKMGHYSNECPEKMNNENENAGLTEVESDVALVMNKMKNEYESPKIWIGDTGATNHMTSDLKGMFEIRKVESNIQVGDGNEIKTTAVGKYRGKIIQRDGTEMAVVLEDVYYVPGIMCNLFAITATLSKGWKLSNEGKVLKLSKGKKSIRFDEVINKRHGHLCGVKIMRRNCEDVALLARNNEKKSYEQEGTKPRIEIECVDRNENESLETMNDEKEQATVMTENTERDSKNEESTNLEGRKIPTMTETASATLSETIMIECIEMNEEQETEKEEHKNEVNETEKEENENVDNESKKEEQK